MNIMFVCTGNTCRSPMLARMFADYARKVGFGCAADSAGMKGGGSPVNPKAACTLAARGLDSDGHISKVFGDAEAGWADFVFTMDEGQRDELRLRYPELRVECLSAFCGSEIADPYGGTQADYDATADIFEALLPAVLDFVEKNSPQAEKDA